MNRLPGRCRPGLTAALAAHIGGVPRLPDRSYRRSLAAAAGPPCVLPEAVDRAVEPEPPEVLAVLVEETEGSQQCAHPERIVAEARMTDNTPTESIFLIFWT